MRDFTLTIYRQLLEALQEKEYAFQPFSGFLQAPEARVVLLRHDVDDRKLHSLQFARLQSEMGIVGTYYFRIVPQSFDEAVIREIHQLGHEIGYHYEDMDLAGGNPQKAIAMFERHLGRIRAVAPVSTICMHGSPRSRYDNKDVWKHYDYRDYGLVGEPYFDLNFKKVFYLTDTGRRWDGNAVSVRDKAGVDQGLVFRSTRQIIYAISHDRFPRQVMFNFHPQRWMDDRALWVREKYVQKAKNVAKYLLIKARNASFPGAI